jgi:hypothetical protein
MTHLQPEKSSSQNAEASFRLSRTYPIRTPGGSLAPVVTILTFLPLMPGLPIINWIRFFVWLGIGLVFYFSYSLKRNALPEGSGVAWS